MKNVSLYCRAVAAIVLVSVTVAVANASAMKDQPLPKPAMIRDVWHLSYEIVNGREPAKARPRLLTLIEANPAVDLPEQFAYALSDENIFTAIMATYEDTLDAAADDTAKTFIRFNMLRTLTLRAGYLYTGPRRVLMGRATKLAEEIASTNKKDAAVWEATGDLYALKDDTTNAVAAYKHLIPVNGGQPALAQYKIGAVYQRLRRYSAAREAYEAGIRADAAQIPGGGMQARHQLYQALASLYLLQGFEKEAVDAMLLSVRVKEDPDAPYPLRLEIANEMLRRGYAKEVREYTEAVLKLTPDDEGAKRLRDAAINLKP